MTCAARILFVLVLSFILIGSIHAQLPQPVQMAGLRPNAELHWQRTSPSANAADGPVLYQLVFTPGTAGTVAKFDTNTRHLVNSDITDIGGMVNIGGLMINGGSGIVTFVGGQTLPAVQLNGVVGIINGGTGISSTGADGNYLRSSAGAWTSSAIQSGDLPSLSGSYVDLTTVQSVGGSKTFNDTISGNGAAASSTGHPGGQFTGGFTAGNNVTGGAGVMGTGAVNLGPSETAGPGVVGHGGNITFAIDSSSVAGDGGQFTGGDVQSGPGIGGNGIVARAGSGLSDGTAGIFINAAPNGGKILSGQNSVGEVFSVDSSGNVNASGRMNVGVYTVVAVPNAVPFDLACTNAADIAIGGGGYGLVGPFGANTTVLRESRPNGANKWRVSCVNLSTQADAACAQAYTVCLSHAQ